MFGSSTVGTVVDRALPARGLPRSLCVQTLLWSVGTGVFLAGEMVYFVRYTGLSPHKVTLGLTISLALGIALNLPLGHLADRVGALRVWQVTALLEAACLVLYLVATSWWTFVLVLCLLAATGTAGNSARNSYTFNALDEGARVATLAYVRSALNIGFVVGGGIAGVLLLFDTHASLALLPIIAAGLLLANAVFISSLPDNGQPPAPRKPTTTARPDSFKALRDRRFLALSIANGGLASMETVLNVVFPLWIVDRTDAPAALVGVMFSVNTAMIIVLQVRASRGAATLSGTYRLICIGAPLVALACLCMGFAGGRTPLYAGAALIVAAYVLLTVGELLLAPAEWALFGEFSSRIERGQYSSVWTLGSQLVRMAAIPGFTLLATAGGPRGWIGIAVVFIISGLAAVAVARGMESARALDRAV